MTHIIVTVAIVEIDKLKQAYPEDKLTVKLTISDYLY